MLKYREVVEPDRSPSAARNPAAIVLAGGLSVRLGRDKVFLEIEGQTLLERAVARLARLFHRILVVTSQVGRERIRESGLEFGGEVSLITDLYPGKGSLGGIYSGLALSPAFHNLVVACDMPFISSQLLTYMMQQALGFDVVIPRPGGHPEPLHAIYSKNCLGPMKGLLDGGQLKIVDFFPQVRIRYIEEEEIAPIDPHRLSFFNINTEADLRRAEELEASLGMGAQP